jgi:LysR family transcriptional activator of glutamate synthase operon
MISWVLIRDASWLLAVAETGHVTDAASVIGTNQPTLSRTIARVERELGVQIFLRTSQGVTVTPTGELVLVACRDLVATQERLRSDLARVLDPERGVVRLAFLDSMATSLVPRILRGFHAVSPRTRVELRQEAAHDILADLESAAVDLAITSKRPADDRYAWHTVQEERLVLVVPPTHRWAGRVRIDLGDTRDEEFITAPPGFAYRADTDALLQDAGVTPTISFESQDLATIEGLVAAGLGIAILPEHNAGASGTHAIAITADAARRSVGLLWRTDRPLVPPAERFRDYVVGLDARTLPS